MEQTIKASDTPDSNPNSRSGQYLRYAYSHIIRAVAAIRLLILFLPDGYAMLIRPNKAETAVHCCHYPGDMAVRMRKVLAGPWVGVRVCHLLLTFIWKPA